MDIHDKKLMINMIIDLKLKRKMLEDMKDREIISLFSILKRYMK